MSGEGQFWALRGPGRHRPERVLAIAGAALMLAGVALWVLGMVPARADSYGSGLTLTPDHGPAGTVIEVKSPGFVPGQPLTATFCSGGCTLMPSQGQIDCEPAAADDTGNVDCKFTVIPAFDPGGYVLTIHQVTQANGFPVCSTAGQYPTPVPVPGSGAAPPAGVPATFQTGGVVYACEVTAAAHFTLTAPLAGTASYVPPVPAPPVQAPPAQSLPAIAAAPPTAPQQPAVQVAAKPTVYYRLLAPGKALVPGVVVFALGAVLLLLAAFPALQDRRRPAPAAIATGSKLAAFVRSHRRNRATVLDNRAMLGSSVWAAFRPFRRL